jgi:leader peptidase (prepilin peptidase)/N-methyltransferase
MIYSLVAYFQAHESFYLVVVALYGLVLGSFLNVLVYRLPVMLERQWHNQAREFLELAPASSDRPISLLQPGSRCPSCGAPVRPWHNIPVLSYLALKGRCAACGTRISLRYPFVELLTAALSVVTAWRFGVTPATLAALVLVWVLIPLAFIDYDHKILPDAITLPFLWGGLLVNSFAVFTDLHSAVIGAMAGYVSLWLVYHGFRLLTGKEGMGYGDFKLLALFGAWLGWQLLPLVVLLSALAGAVIGGTYLTVSKSGRDHPIPFGPFLCIAGWIALLWGHEITHAYLRFAHLSAS